MSVTRFFRFPWATSGDKTAIPDTVQSSGAVSYPQGFGPDYERDPETDPLAKRVPRDETNQLYYDLTSNVQAWQLAGLPEWVLASQNGGAAVEYPLGAMVRWNFASLGWQNYVSLVEDNVTEPDPFGTGDWAVIAARPFMTAQVVFSTAGATNWTVPAGVYKIKVRIWGGGGGGGGAAAYSTPGGGGGAGEYGEGLYDVTPGDIHVVTVGAGTSGAGNGGTSSLGSLITAVGGTTGGNGGSGGAGGGGGTGGTGGDFYVAGGSGTGPFVYSGSSVEGGSGGASWGTGITRASGPNTAPGFDGNNGSFPGGGGSGASVNSGNGARGCVVIEY